jgi:hypothetical protein
MCARCSGGCSSAARFSRWQCGAQASKRPYTCLHACMHVCMPIDIHAAHCCLSHSDQRLATGLKAPALPLANQQLRS